MEKPFTAKINEFKNKLCQVINEAELPAYVLLNELNSIAIEIQKQDNAQIQEYINSLKKEGSEEECKK